MRRVRLLPLTASVLCAGLTLATPVAVADPSHSGAGHHGRRSADAQTARVTLPDTVPAWAAAKADQGLAPSQTPVSARIYLAGRDRAGLEALARSVSDPDSAHYGHYLTPAQVRSRFGATRQQIDAVRAWLDSAGFHVVGGDRHYLSVTGNPAAVQRAFATTLHTYRKDGRVYTAPSGAASVPKEIADAVLSVTGLDSAPHHAIAQSVRDHAAAPAAPGRDAPAATASAAPSGGKPSASASASAPASASASASSAAKPTGPAKPKPTPTLTGPAVASAAPAAPSSAPSTAPSVSTTELPGPEAAFVNSPPSSTYYGERNADTLPKAYGATQPYVNSGYTGKQLRDAYGVTATKLTGAGSRVAIIDAYDSPTLTKDTAAYAAAHGDAPYRTGQLVSHDATAWTDTEDPDPDHPDGCGASGWYGEQTLDVEAVHAVAPAADIAYVGAASCSDADLMDALNKVVDGHLADEVSDSWGEPEQGSDPTMDPVYNHTFATGAVEGIGFYFSSGDNGDEQAATDTKQTDMPASLPWVTAVGGTSLGIGKDDSYLFETGWGTSKATLSSDGKSWSALPGAFASGAGGGVSSRVAEPSYQWRVVPKTLAHTKTGDHRVVPDISAVADPNTGFLIGQTQTWPNGTVRYGEYRIGGTSLAAPVIAAVQALAQQAQGTPLGFANPEIYARYGSQSFHDVTDQPYGPKRQLAEVRVDYANQLDATHGTATTLRGLGRDSSLTATPGYDEVTGVGTPTADYLRSFTPNTP